MILLPIRAQSLKQYEIDLLVLAAGTKDLDGILHVYDAEKSQTLLVYRPEMKTLGICGLERLDAKAARILHIAVDGADQRKHIGRLIVEASFAELGFTSLCAETDSDAVGFYSACGFNVESLGEKYPGVERFECTLRR